jgi:epoxyqueuosine reductase QueG
MGKVDYELTREVYDLLATQEVDLIGVAPVERFNNVPDTRHPHNILSSCLNVLVFGIQQIGPVVDNLPSSRYTFTQQYLTVTRKLDHVAMSVSRLFEKARYNSIQIPSEGFYNKQTLQGHLSHVETAVFAGLGEIGLSGLLLTPQFGPKVQLVSVINDAPLASSPMAETGLCTRWQAGCKKACTRLCPAGAISESGLDKAACNSYQNKFLTVGAYVYAPSVLCGLCIKGCPVPQQ